ncbi:M56 family metallopeptidase [bacterium]|nr:MAG: M56 family metallopeptidase [bacterium]
MDKSLVERLGWTLIHFAWEGTAVAMALAVFLWLTRRASAGLRYGLSCTALALLVALPIATFLALAPTASLPGELLGTSRGLSFSLGETIAGDSSPYDRLLPLLVGIWAAGVTVLCIRLIGTLFHMERWKRRHTRPVASEWQARVDALAQRLGIAKAVEVLVSDDLNVPSAWGVLKAVVVMPASLLTQLPQDQLETILLHELAHIRRHDYLVNLLQTVVETVLFYHPAVWWVSSVVRREREHCCDDVVVCSLSDPMPYARALFTLEERRLTLPHPTLSAKGSNLMNRIARILGAKPAPARISPAASTLAVMAVVAAVLGGTLQAQAQSNVQKAEKPPVKKVNGKKLAKPAKRAVKPSQAKKVTGVQIQRPASGKAIKGSAVFIAQPSQTETVVGTKVAEVAFVAVGQDGTKFQSVPATTVSAVAIQTATPVKGQKFASKSIGFKAVEVKSAIGQNVTISRAVAETTPALQHGGAMGGGSSNGVSVTSGMGGGSFGGGGFGGSVSASEAVTTVELGATENLFNIDMKADVMRGGSFAATLRKLAKLTKSSIVIEAGVYIDSDLVLSDRSVEDVIEILCRSAKATYRVEKGVYYITSTYGQK